MKLRIATLSDANAIANLHTASWRSTYHSVLTKEYLQHTVPIERKAVWKQRLEAPGDNQYILVAESKKSIVGFACAFAGENPEWGSYLDNLHVSKSHQSKGLGRSLLIKVAQWCNQQFPGNGLCLLVNQASVWDVPDGSLVPTYWFVWDTVKGLIENG